MLPIINQRILNRLIIDISINRPSPTIYRDRHCTSNIAINISIFHLGLIRGARAYCPDAARRGAVGPTHC